MLLNLERLLQESTIPGGKFVSSPITINSEYVISIKPASSRWSSIKEVNNRPVKNCHATEICISNGDSVESVVVLGRYEDLVEKIKGKSRSILYG